MFLLNVLDVTPKFIASVKIMASNGVIFSIAIGHCYNVNYDRVVTVTAGNLSFIVTKNCIF